MGNATMWRWRGPSGLRWVWRNEAGNPFQTTQGNRLSCRDQEGRRGSEEAVPGPSVLPSKEPGVAGNFWGSEEGSQGPFRPSGRNRGLPLRLSGEPGVSGDFWGSQEGSQGPFRPSGRALGALFA